MLLAQIAALAIGVPLAIACAVRSGSSFDRFMTGTAFGMLSVPTFLSAILLIYLFAVELRWLPAKLDSKKVNQQDRGKECRDREHAEGSASHEAVEGAAAAHRAGDSEWHADREGGDLRQKH